MAANGPESIYTCRCLNVRIHSQLPHGTPPTSETDFEPVYVGDKGISVIHTQVTLRSRSRPVRDVTVEPSRHTRYMSLTCLICHCLVYRVSQLVDPVVDSGEGPVLPTDEWAEQDLLKSITGWIHVSSDCMKGEAIATTEASPSYSKLYKVVLPAGLPSWSFGATPSTSSSPQNSTQPSRRHLPPLPPLFLPPPFTPSHLVFHHLSSIALSESENIRSAAEEYLAKVAKEKAAEIEATEAALKKELEILWSKFKEGLDSIEPGGASGRPSSTPGRRASGSRWSAPTSLGVNQQPSSVRISEFSLAQHVPPRTSSRASSHQVTSALSASLATSSFHHPRAQQKEAAASARASDSRSLSSPPPHASTSPSPSRSSTMRGVSPSTASSRTVAVGINGEASTIREAYRRNMDQSKDIATSFKYVIDMEQRSSGHLAHSPPAPEPEASDSVDVASSSSIPVVPRGRSPRAGKSSIRKEERDGTQSGSKGKQPASPGKNPENNGEKSPKGKRKVTFDVKPTVAVIETNGTEVNSSEPPEPDGIFDMENEEFAEQAVATEQPPPLNGDASGSQRTNHEPTQPSRRIRSRLQDNYGLPASLSSLRPASLPNVSTVRPPLQRDEPQGRPRSQAVRDSVVVAAEQSRGTTSDLPVVPDYEDIGDISNPREAEILRLVAASTPSHRSAWKKDSKAWQLFVNRQNRRSKDLGPVAIEEEEEDDTSPEYDGPRLGRPYNDSDSDDLLDGRRDLDAPMASSLPIPIISNAMHLGTASYQPKTSLTDRPGMMVPALRVTSSAAMRRAMYAERDRIRAIDPGALEFTDDLDDEEEDVHHEPEVGSVGRQRAFQILKARSELPEAGMWRSLA